MKLVPGIFISSFALGALLNLPACSDNHAPSSRPGHAQVRAQNPDEVDRDDDAARSHPPRLGMTKAEVRMQYGKPSDEERSGGGDTWFYNPDSVKGLDFIPYYGIYHTATKKRRGGTIYFGPDGRVVDFNWKSYRSIPVVGTNDAMVDLLDTLSS